MHNTRANRQIWSQPAVPLAKINQHISDYALLRTASHFLIAVERSVRECSRGKREPVAVVNVIRLQADIFRKVPAEDYAQRDSALRIVRREICGAGAKSRGSVSGQSRNSSLESSIKLALSERVSHAAQQKQPREEHSQLSCFLPCTRAPAHRFQKCEGGFLVRERHIHQKRLTACARQRPRMPKRRLLDSPCEHSKSFKGR